LNLKDTCLSRIQKALKRYALIFAGVPCVAQLRFPLADVFSGTPRYQNLLTLSVAIVS
jgi:hypothetical protein